MVASSSLPWMLINLLFAGLALGIGFVAGAFFYGGRDPREANEDVNEQERALEKRVALERALLATGQLHDLATGVATDVGNHSRCVAQISADLREAEDADGVIDQAIVSTSLSKIVAANELLQKKLEKAEKQIKAQASEIAVHESEARTDSLTGLANRRAFDDELGRRFAEWERKKTPFCLVILDVDHFKNFNDTHGHQAGDEVLKRVATSMKASTRTMDIPCRYGGEEFAVVLPATTLDDAMPLAERVRAGIEKELIKHEGKELKVTASIGVAQIDRMDDAKNILRRADESLYCSKDAGRNCGYAHIDGECVPVMDRIAKGKVLKAGKTDKSDGQLLIDQLPTRTMFVNQLTQRVAESQRNDTPLAVLVVELNSIAEIQSKYGQTASRRMLDSVAQFLVGSLREMDAISLLENERFGVMLPNATAEDAETIARRASSALSMCSVPMGDTLLQLDAKLAFTCIKELDTATLILKRAEEAVGEVAGSSEPLLV
ncbi:Response regulator PleD [Posidoniimonas polymericola]|uniref:diguanylate cyclase n=1 Tax=Posidoniimonas polymericola TaxID=2528002 RepID=A0A5C5XX12_9BACT|nr:GGDEF domain-containing protein [Posidoniimonas polymericola]TWT66883.1 Response regulator PleD [Posidoniimonas polymericola]